MAHLLYTVGKDGYYNHVKAIRPFSGKNGVIYKALVAKQVFKTGGPNYEWVLQEAELLRHVPRIDKINQQPAIVFDIVPGRKDRVLLVRLTEMWGFTDDLWTPLLLKLRLLYQDDNYKGNRVRLKKRFKPGAPKDIYEFLYLRGGYKSGKFIDNWVWGPVGSVNATLLYGRALAYFLRQIHGR